MNAYLREATMEDMDLLLEWANDPVTRANSFSTDPIPYENHVRWFTKLLANPHSRQFILMVDEKPCGQCRADITDGIAEIDCSIAPGERRHGYGDLMFNLLVERLKQEPEITTIRACVKTGNTGSEKCLLSSGFQKKYEVLERNL